MVDIQVKYRYIVGELYVWNMYIICKWSAMCDDMSNEKLCNINLTDVQ